MPTEPTEPSDPTADVVTALRTAGCVFAEDEAELLVAAAGELAAAGGETIASAPTTLAALVARRVAGEPLEQVLGWAEFCGLRIAVAPGVFVPRRRTELLAESALALAAGVAGTPVVVDLCCGTGAVGLAVAAGLTAGNPPRRVELHASDVDPAAVACAAANLAGVGQVHVGDLFAALPGAVRGRVDLLLANAPYVPTAAIGTMPREARDHEPQVALDGGHDGLALHRRIAADAAAWLGPQGHLLIESSRAQADATAAAMRRGGLAPRIVHDEDRDATVVVGARHATG